MSPPPEPAFPEGILTPPPTQTDSTNHCASSSTAVVSVPGPSIPLDGVSSVPLQWLEHFKTDGQTFGLYLLSPRYLGAGWKGLPSEHISAAAAALETKVEGVSWLQDSELQESSQIRALKNHVLGYRQIFYPLVQQLGEFDRDLREALNARRFSEPIVKHGFMGLPPDANRYFGGDHALLRTILLDRLFWAGISTSVGLQSDTIHQLPIQTWVAEDSDRSTESRLRQPLTDTREWMKEAAMALIHLGAGLDQQVLTEETMTTVGAAAVSAAARRRLCLG